MSEHDPHVMVVARFPLGETVVTAAVHEWMLESLDERAVMISAILKRHVLGDWGEVDDEDRQANDDALENGSRLLSVYEVDDVVLWVITEHDRSVTTVLFPDDY